MPHSATIEDIKAYQEKVEKDKITPNNLPRCSRCELESQLFKVHSHRERRFLVIIKMIVEAVYCSLVRFKCPNCGKTYTWYPDFALPYKHYTRQTIESFSRAYIEDDEATYEKAIIIDGSAPGYPDNSRVMAGSTVHRWISTLADLIIVYQTAFAASLRKQTDHNPDQLNMPGKKYKSLQRMASLLRCRFYLNTWPFAINRLSPTSQ